MIAPPWAENTCQAKHENAIVVLCHGGWNCPGRCTAEKKQFFFRLILLMEEILHQLSLVVHPIIYQVFYIQKVVKARISSVWRWKDERSSKYRSKKCGPCWKKGHGNLGGGFKELKRVVWCLAAGDSQKMVSKTPIKGARFWQINGGTFEKATSQIISKR